LLVTAAVCLDAVKSGYTCFVAALVLFLSAVKQKKKEVSAEEQH
jgi:hypothetical protein